MIFFKVIFFLTSASAYPELVRHGYFNCIACHVSPSGGGVLTEYGRSMSKEILSTWGREGEEQSLYGVLPEFEGLRVGGNIRGIQTYLDDPTVRAADSFVMQSDVEVALTIKNWILALTAGTEGGPRTYSKKDQFLSRRHYIGYKINEEWAVRYGRFLSSFGWNQSNHTMVTERNLGFDQGRETYNTEISYLGEKWNMHVSHLAGRPDDSSIDGERGVAISSGLSVAEKNQIGASALMGKTNAGGHRQIFGFFGLWAFSEKFYWLFEVDHQWRQPNLSPGINTEQKGFVSYHRFNSEFYRGVHLYLLHQIRYLNYHSSRNRMDSYGLGLQIFPRPHWEIQVEFQRQRDLSLFDTYYDSAFFLAHFYL